MPRGMSRQTYSREQIYTAIRRADEAGDGEAVRALSARLQEMDAPKQEQPEPQQRQSNLLDATRNMLGGMAEGAASAVLDFPRDIARPAQEGLTYAMTHGPAAALDAVGAEGAADWLRERGNTTVEAGRSQPRAADVVGSVLPAEPGMEAARVASQFIGGALVPTGPKAAPRPQVRTPRPQSAAQDVVRAGEANNVRVMTTDVAPPRSFVGKTVQTVGERIPYAGTGPARVAQQEQRVNAVRRVAEEYGVDGGDDFLQAISKNLTDTRSKMLTGLSNRKNAVIDGIEGQVPTERAVKAIDEQIDRLSKIDSATLSPVIGKLRIHRDNLASGKSLREVEEIRKLIGGMFKGDDLSDIKDVGEKAIRAIYGPLRDDMAEFIRQKGGQEAVSRWKGANDRLAAMAGELGDNAFKRVLRSSETTPEKVGQLLFSKNPSEVRRLMGNLSEAGRQRARSAIIYRALDKAGDLQQLSPKKFANEIDRLASNVGVVFRPADRTAIEGLARLLQYTERASVAGVAPPTGAQNNLPILAAVLADWFGSAGAAITSGGLAGLVARLYESAPVRNRLIGLAKSSRGSVQERNTVTNIAKVLASQTEAGTLRAANNNAALPTGAVAQDENGQK